MFLRRTFLQGKFGFPFLASWFGQPVAAAKPRRDFFAELNLRPFINAAEPFTTLSGSLMPPEVAEAWQYAVSRYVRLDELHDAVGKRLAALIGCEAAMVTSGAASALTLATAACLTGLDREKIRRLPDTTGMKNEVIIQKSHRYGYDHAVRNCGIRYVEIESAEELERAVGPMTAMLHFFNTNEPAGRIKLAEFAALGKKHGIPVLNDIAADVPPLSNFSRSLQLGCDLVAVSGGKGLRGPQSCGLLYGNADLIKAARWNGPPNSDAIGRGQKVNKEEMLAMMVTLELYFRRDHEADWREWERRVNVLRDAVSTVPGVAGEMFVPEIHYRCPHLRLRWDQHASGLTVAAAIRRLRDGDPSIEVRPNSGNGLELSVWMLEPAEVGIVARRLREVLKKT
ncbi:MAG: aminotransferase class V-fold PLP-dependent enzyme [Bryobacterales bacterium]|nr:aminotransferase class V-fold PLP-dependent enzyme [Bryobacterales bacterium]